MKLSGEREKAGVPRPSTSSSNRLAEPESAFWPTQSCPRPPSVTNLSNLIFGIPIGQFGARRRLMKRKAGKGGAGPTPPWRWNPRPRYGGANSDNNYMKILIIKKILIKWRG